MASKLAVGCSNVQGMALTTSATVMVVTGVWTDRDYPHLDIGNGITTALSTRKINSTTSSPSPRWLTSYKSYLPITQWHSVLSESGHSSAGPYVAAVCQLLALVWTVATVPSTCVARKNERESGRRARKILPAVDAGLCAVVTIAECCFAHIGPIQFKGFYVAAVGYMGIMALCSLLYGLEFVVPSIRGKLSKKPPAEDHKLASVSAVDEGDAHEFDFFDFDAPESLEYPQKYRCNYSCEQIARRESSKQQEKSCSPPSDSVKSLKGSPTSRECCSVSDGPRVQQGRKLNKRRKPVSGRYFQDRSLKERSHRAAAEAPVSEKKFSGQLLKWRSNPVISSTRTNRTPMTVGSQYAVREPTRDISRRYAYESSPSTAVPTDEYP